MSWWNTKYGFRRKLRITPSTGLTIRAGYPLFARLSYPILSSANKIRPDLLDVEVLYLENDGVTWTVLPSLASFAGDDVIIYFNAVTDITTVNEHYYIYSSNPNLASQPVTPVYAPNLYSIDTSTTGGIGLSFTRPTEDWQDNKSSVTNARATFSFYGVDARMVIRKGPDQGILELTVDNKTPVLIDAYNATVSDQIVYTTSNLTLGQHYLRVRVTGDKSAYSSGDEITLVKVEYSQYTQAVDLGEEISDANLPIRITVGP